MKTLTLIFSFLFLTACAPILPGDAQIEVDVPNAHGQTVYKTYPLSDARNCIFTLVDWSGKEYAYQSYGYSCNYNANGYIESVTLEFYSTDSGTAYLTYNY